MFQRFSNLDLGHKINLGFAVLVLVLLLIVGLIFVAGSAATNRINLTVDVRVPTTLSATSAQSNLLKMQAAVRGYLAVGDLQNINDYNQAREQFQENLTELRTLSANWTNQQDVARLNELSNIFAAWLSTPDRLFQLHDNPLENQPALRLETVNAQPLSTALLSDTEGLAQHLQRQDAASPNTIIFSELTELRSSFEGMSTNLSAYAATGNLLFKFRYADELVANSRHFGALLDLLAANEEIVDETAETLIEQIVEARTELLALSNRIFGMVEGEQSHLDLYLFQNEMEPQTEQMVELLEALVLSQETLLQAELNEGNRSLADLRYQTLLGGVMVLLLGAAMVYIFRRNIAKPLHRLSRTAERIGAGDLTARADVETDDEIGQLAISFNQMTSQLNETFDALAEAKDSAEKASRAKSKFLASMSHELRTPLNIILGYVQILQRRHNQPPASGEALDAIAGNGEHLLTLISDILDLSKIEAQKLELYPTCFSLTEFLEKLMQAYQHQARNQKGIEFSACLSQNLPTFITADEKRLRQILLNLLDNAFKFTHEGRVKLDVALLEAADDAVRLRFTVSDTGVGMSAQERTLVFRPFEQVGASAQHAKGTGLGLAIAQELAYAMNSELMVESTLDEGSSFWFTAQFSAKWAHSGPLTKRHGLKTVLTVQSNGSASIPVNQQLDIQRDLPHISEQELAELFDLALKGELPNLEQKSAELITKHHVNKPFVDTLHSLIKTYEEDKIIELLQSWQQGR